MKRLILLCFIVLGFVFTSYSQPCKNLPVSFTSYSQAVKAIKAADFSLTDKLPDGKSSWIVSANYYSCDRVTGYMIYSTIKGSEYIHEKVPIRVWNEFKNAASSGSYYDHNIKGKYRLIPY
jgi:hypothetical protein